MLEVVFVTVVGQHAVRLCVGSLRAGLGGRHVSIAPPFGGACKLRPLRT